MASDLLSDLRDVADALTDPRQHREPRYGIDAHKHKVVAGQHITIQPGLLQQLADMAYPGAGGDDTDSGGRAVPGSRPPGDVDAISAYVSISVGVVRWCHSLRLDLRDTVESNLRQVVATTASREDRDTQITLLSELRSWRNWCEAITGWRVNATPLPLPCPHCGERQLRVNLAGPTARCMACRVEWDADTVGVLARVLEAYRVEARAKADEARRVARERQDVRDGRAPVDGSTVAVLAAPESRVDFPAWVRVVA